MNVGVVALPFVCGSRAEELAKVMRYLQKSYRYTDTPGTVTNIGGEQGVSSVPLPFSGRNGGYMSNFLVSMRITPVITSYSPVTGTSGLGRDYTAGADSASVNVQAIDEKQYMLVSSLPATNILGSHWKADARFTA